MKRKTRRAEKAVPPPSLPSIRGGDESCGNCYFSACRESYAKIVAAQNIRFQSMGAPTRWSPLPDDETFCLYDTQDKAKKLWGWCGKWKERTAK